MFKYIKKIIQLKSIDTITTKLLLLVLFITIIPMIAVTNFSNTILNQSLLNNAKQELGYYSDLFNKTLKQNLNDLFLITEISVKNYLNDLILLKETKSEKTKLLKKFKDNSKIDLVLFINKDKKVISADNNINGINLGSNFFRLLSIAFSGEIIKSTELLTEKDFKYFHKPKKFDNLYNLVFYPIRTTKGEIKGVFITGKKINKSFKLLNENTNVLIKTINEVKINEQNKKSQFIIKDLFFKNYMGNTIGYAYITIDNLKFIQPLVQNTKSISIISVISLLVAILIAALFARTITSPIFKLVNSAKSISEGDLDSKVNIRGNDEIAQLANTFNKMAEELKKQEQLRDNFVATLTHDLKVPMLAENQTINYLLKEAYGPITTEQEEVLNLIKSTNNSSLEMVSTLLEVYRYDMGSFNLLISNFNLINLIKESIEQIKSLAEDKKIKINFENTDKLFISADEREIKRVIHNLISNAISNGIHRGHINCTVENFTDKNEFYYPLSSSDIYTTLNAPLKLKDMVIISIKDDGIGISREEMPELFKRFSLNRGRKPAGTGLGLYYSHQVISKHKGYIWAESAEGKGCTFKFAIPINTN